jgi:multidrug efflux pump subunit AcrB
MRDACIGGTREVASAITSSTLTTVAVFLPLGFVGGLVSQFFLPFALTVTFALLASLVCALTVVPVLASLFIDRIKLDPDEGPQHHDTLVQRLYTPLLKAALHNRRSRWGVIGIAAVLVLGPGCSSLTSPLSSSTPARRSSSPITVAPPSGTPSSVVLQQARVVEAKLKSYSEVKLIEATVPSEGDTGLSALAPPSPAERPTPRRSSSVSTAAPTWTRSRRSSPRTWPSLQDGWQIQVAQDSMTGSSSISVVVSGPTSTDVANATTRSWPASRRCRI